MRRGIRQRQTLFFIAGFSVLLLSGWGVGAGSAKELPEPATVGELSARPEQYDGLRVFVTGRVKTIKIEIGRRGSEFVAMTLEEESAEGREAPLIRVFTLTFPPVFEGNRVSVQGTYHREGRFGGWPFEEFIEAEAIIREK